MLNRGFLGKCVIVLLLLCNQAIAVNFYSKSTGDPSVLATWGQNTDGTGAAPSDFTSNSQIFFLTNTNSGTLGANWTVSGTSSKVVIGEGLVSQSLTTSTFTISGTFDVANLGTLNVQSNSTFTLGTCSSGSTVAYNGDLDQSVRAGTYHHLTLTSATSSRNKTASGAITVNGNLTVNTNNVLVMATNLISGVTGTISGDGSITTTNTSTTPIPNSKTWTQTVTYSGATSGVASGTYENLTVSTAGTKTAQGNITVNTALNVSATLDMVANTLSGTFTPSSAGTINTQNTGSTPLPAGKTWTQNITYNANASTQTVVKGIYNLALDVKGAGAGGSRTFPSGGDTIEVKGAFTANAASVTYTTTGTRFIFSGGAQTLTFVSTSVFTFGYVSFTVASALTKTIAGAGFSADSLNVGSLCTLAMVTFDLAGNLTSIAGPGIITTTNTGATPLPTGKIWTQTVNYTGATQTIVSGTYASLTYAAGTKTAGGDITVNTLLTSTGTLDLVTNTLSGTFTNSGTGAINTQNTTATPIPAGKTWTQTLVYNATGAQTVVKGIFGGLNVTGTTSGATRTFPANSDTIEVRGAFTAANVSGVAYNASGTRFLFTTATKNLTFDPGSTFNFGYVVFSGAFVNTVVGNGFGADTLNVATTATLTMSTFQLSGTLNIIAGLGTITTANTSATPIPAGKIWSQNITYNSASTQTVVKGTYTLALNVNLGSRNFPTGGDTVEVRGAFTASTASVTYTTTGARFLFSTAAQTLTFGTSTFNFGYVSFTAAFTKTTAGAGFSADTLIVGTGCTLAMVTFQLSGTLSSISGNGIITTTNTGSTPIPTGKIWTQTVNYTGATQTIVSGTYASLTYAAGTKTAGGDITVNTLLTSTGTLDLVTNTLSGTFTNSGTGAINTQNTTATPIPAGKTWTQTLVYNATGAQTVVKGIFGGLNVTGTTSGATRTFPANSDTIEVRGAFTAANVSGVAYNASGTRFLFTTATKNLTFDPGSTFNFGYVVFSGAFVNTVAGNGFGADTLNVATTATLTMSTFQLSGTLNIIAGLGTITTANTSATPIPAGKIWSQNITYNSASTQTVVKGTYTLALNVNLGSRNFPTGGDTVEVRGAFTASTASVTYTTTGTRFIFSTAAQTLTFGTSAFNFGYVSFTVPSALTKTIAGAGFSADTLNVGTNCTLAMVTFQLGGALTSITGNGTITTTNTSSTPIPAGKIWSQNITYSSTSGQTVVKGVYTLALNVAGAAGSRTFPTGGDTIEVRGAFTANGASITYTTTGTRFIFSGGAQTLTFVATSTFNFGYVSFTGTSVTKTVATAGFNVDTLNVASGITLNMVTFAMGGNVTLTSGSGIITTQALTSPLPGGKTWLPLVNYNDIAGTQNVIGGTYEKLTLTLTGNTARTKTATGNITVNDSMVLSASGTSAGILTLNMQTNRLIAGGAFLLVISGATAPKNIQTQCTDAIPLPVNISWPTTAASTVTYNGTSDQTVVIGTYLNLTLSGTGNRSLASGDINITGNLTAGSGPTIVGGSSNIRLTGVAQTIALGASGSFNHFRALGTGDKTVTASTGTLTVDSTLEVLASRQLIMNNNQLAGNIIGGTSGTGTITTTSTATAPITAGKTWLPNITYSATTSQNVVKGIYTAALNVAGGVGTRVFPSGRDTVEVRGNFTANAASVTYTTTGTRFIFSGGAQTLTFVGTSTFNFGYVSFTGTSVTKTIATAGFSVDTLNIDSGNTLNMVTFAIGGNITLTTGKGTIRTQHATAAFPVAKTWVPLVNFDADATQNVIGGNYTKLSISILTTARSKTATGDITVSDTMVYASTGSAVLTFSMSTFRLIDGGAFFLSSVGTGLKSTTTNYTNTDTAFKPLPSNQTWPGIVTYSSATHQTVVAGIYVSTLTVSGGIRTFSAINTIEVKGAFTASTATTYTTTGTSFLFSGGAQTLTLVASPVFSFNNVLFTGSAVTKTVSAAFNINGNLNIDTTVTLNMVTFAMGGNPAIITGAGIITTQALLLALPAGEIWTQTVNYNDAAGTQNIIGGRYANLTLSLSGTTARSKTATDSITVNKNFTLTTSSTGVLTLTMGVYRLIDGGAFTLVNSGTALKHLTTNCSNADTTFKPLPSNQTWPGNVTYGSASHQTVVTGIYTGTLLVTLGSRTFSADGTIEARGAFTANTASVTYSATGSTFLFSTAAQTLTFGTSAFNFNNVSFTGTSITKTIAGAGFGVNGTLNIASTVTLNMVTFAMSGNPTTISGNGTITTQCVTAPLPTGEVWTQTVNYNVNAAQQISGGEYAKLSISAVSSSTRIKTVTGGDLQVNDTLSLINTSTGIITLEMAANRLIAGGSFNLFNSGTTARNINTQSTAASSLPSGITWPGTSTVTYNAASGTQTIPAGTYVNLTITGSSGKVAAGNMTVNGILTLTSPNASSSLGCLDMGTNTLTMGSAATTSGANDVTGIVKRTGMVHSTAYTFGTQNTRITFQNTGTLPSEISMRIKLGTAPAWKTNAMLRQYELIQTGGSATQATLRLKYVDAELNSNIESRLVLWRDSLGTKTELGRSTNDATNNYVELTPVDIASYPSTFGSDTLTLANTQNIEVVWEGSVDNNWNNLLNWNNNIVPDSNDNVTIPDSASTPFDPRVPATARVKKFSIESGAYLDCISGASLGIYGSDSSGIFAWDCEGSFIPGNSTVTFFGTAAGCNGTTNFNNITIQSGAKLTNQSGSIMRIGGSITNSGTWQVDSTASTVEYSGSSAQTIISPNGTFAGYYDLTASGAGAKTFPSAIIIKGDWTNNSVTGTAGDVTFTGVGNQQISGSTATTFGKFTVNNGNSVVLSGVSVTVNDSLKLTSGILDLNGFSLTAVGPVSGIGTISGSSASNISITGSGDFGTLAFTAGADSLNNLTINRTSGTVTLGSDLTVAGATALTTTALSIGANTLTINGNYTATTSTITGGGNSNIMFNGSGTPASVVAFTTGARLVQSLTINRGASDTITLGSDLNTTDLNLTTGILALNNNNLGIDGVTTGAGTIKGSSGSDLSITGTGNLGTIAFTAGNRTVNNLTVNRTVAGTATLASDLAVAGSLTLTRGLLEIGAHTLTLNGNFSGSDSAALSGNGASSNLTIGGSGSIDTLFFDQTTDGTTNELATFIINRSGVTGILGSDLRVSSALTLTDGKLAIGSNTLSIGGSLTNTSSNCLVANASSNLAIIGSGAMGNSIFFDQTTPATTNCLANLSVNRASQTITLGNALQVTGIVTPVAGTLASAGNLTLISTASATARIADGGCTTCNYITGNVAIQRHIPSVARRYRFLGSPVKLTTLADWKAEVYITGPGGATNGFDATSSNAPSLYSYNEALITGDLNIGWTAAAKISDTLVVGKGVRMFIRGDRSDTGRLTGAVNTQNQVTLDLVGVPNQGDIVMPVSNTFSGGGSTYVPANDGWNLVANPYASPYDWDAHYSNGSFQNNIDPSIWILDAQNGGYISYNALAHAGDLTGGIIPPGASFWVKANAASPVLTFKEQFKVGTTHVGVYKTNQGENFSIKLYYDSVTYDVAGVKYMDEAIPDYDAYDIRKLVGTVTISSFGDDSIQLGLNTRPPTLDPDTIKLRVSGANGNYKLKFANSDVLPVAENVLLFDNYLSTVTDLKTTDVYDFSIASAVPESQGLGRFYIVIGNSDAMPVHLLQFAARKISKSKVRLNWSTAQEVNSKTFEIERSADGKIFKTIGSVDAGGNTQRVINYMMVDAAPQRVNYYRLKQIDFDGSVSYSQVQYVIMDEVAVARLYPVPAHTTLTIEHANVLTQVRITDISGRLISTQNVFTSKAAIDVSTLETGVYIIEYSDELGQTYKEKFTKE